jgi:hypothetical protein
MPWSLRFLPSLCVISPARLCVQCLQVFAIHQSSLSGGLAGFGPAAEQQ